MSEFLNMSFVVDVFVKLFHRFHNVTRKLVVEHLQKLTEIMKKTATTSGDERCSLPDLVRNAHTKDGSV